MAYGAHTNSPYTAGASPSGSIASRDLGRTTDAFGHTPEVQEVTHGITGVAAPFRVVTVAAGTPVQFNGGSSLQCIKVGIQALETNSGPIVFGGSNAVRASYDTNLNGILLYQREYMELEVDDASKFWLDSRVSGDGVSVTAYT